MLPLVILLTLTGCSSSNVANYLQSYGYLDTSYNESNSPLAVQTALQLFQVNYNLPINKDGNYQTLELMKRPRCGNKDKILHEYSTTPKKWNNKLIKWYNYANEIPLALIEKAFAIYSKHADIQFTMDNRDPQIIFTFSWFNHTRKDNSYCTPFLPNSSVLAHADLPEPGLSVTEIHINGDHNWLKTVALPADGEYSLFFTLIHEIGHTLGLEHETNDATSIMYPYYEPSNLLNDMINIDLDPLTIGKIQAMYGRKPVPEKVPEKSVQEINVYSDLCSFKYKIEHVLIVEKSIYFFYRNMVWQIPLVKNRRYSHHLTRPFVINNWLKNIPSNFSQISAIYQNKRGEINVFINRNYYRFSYPQLVLRDTKPITSLTGLHSVSNILTAYKNNLGSTVYLTNQYLILEHDQCTSQFVISGSAIDYIGVNPKYISSIFRHTNGKLYFFHKTDNYLIEYDDYLQMVTGRVSNALDLFNITCTEANIINDLYEYSKTLLQMKRES